MFFSILPGLNSNGIGPPGKMGNWKANGRFFAFCNCHTISYIEGLPRTVEALGTIRGRKRQEITHPGWVISHARQVVQ